MNILSNTKKVYFHIYQRMLLLVMCTAFISVVLFYATSCFAQASNSPTNGDIFIAGTVGQPTNLLPMLSSDSASSNITQHLYVSLLKYDKDITIVPFAAKSYEVLDNGLRLRFVLRKGIYWQDGVELTVDDVEFTYKLMIDPNTKTAYSSDFKQVTSFTKLDKYTFEVTYSKPFARSLVTWMSAIMPKHALEGTDINKSPLARSPLSCGPFTMNKWDPGVAIRLKANPTYFKGRPHFDAAMYQFIPDSSTLFLELKASNLDTIDTLTPQQFLFQAQKAAFKKEFSVYKSLSFTYTYLGYNLKNPLFADVRVRKAFAHAINKQDIIKGALLGQGVPTIGPYKPGMWVYNSQITDYEFTITKAEELLKEAGWEKNSDGKLVKDGKFFAFTLLVNQGNETRIKTATIIQSQLKKLGVDVQIRTVEWAAFLKQFVEPGYFDAVVLAWSLPQDPDGYTVWHTDSQKTGLNFISYSNPEVDTLLEEARTTFDEKKRKVLYDRLQVILHDEQPYCFLFVPYTLIPVQNRIQGIAPAPAGLMHNFNDWWVPTRDQRHRIQP